MNFKSVLGIVAIVGSMACGLIGTILLLAMLDKVNAKLPDSERFPFLGWYWSKSQRLHSEYRRLYPDGSLLLYTRIVTALMFIFLGLGLFAFWGLQPLSK